MMDATAYGAGKAGVPFDPIAFIQKPQVILRILCWLFSIIVFGCISSQGWSGSVCLYNGDANACNFGVGIGVIAFLASLAFLVLEAMFTNISAIKSRKQAVMIDLGFSGFWTFMWFVAFCYLTDAWRQAVAPQGGYGVNNVRAAIAFSFFSIFPWAGCAFFAFQRYKQGADQAFAPGYDADPNAMPGGGAPYSTYPGEPDANEGYQEAPFSGGPTSEKVAPPYQAPTAAY